MRPEWVLCGVQGGLLRNIAMSRHVENFDIDGDAYKYRYINASLIYSATTLDITQNRKHILITH